MANSTTANASKRKVIIIILDFSPEASGSDFRFLENRLNDLTINQLNFYTPEVLTCLIYSALSVCGKRCEMLQ
ncbi:hypothetical protein J2X17_003522 [Flavobacterium aquidurense]|nr:hypothetical protein [Flavobacterium aquidurense]